VRQPVSLYTRKSLTIHPPYGLFLDPHGGRHNWTLLESRFLIGLTTAVGAIAASLLVAAR